MVEAVDFCLEDGVGVLLQEPWIGCDEEEEESALRIEEAQTEIRFRDFGVPWAPLLDGDGVEGEGGCELV